MDDYVKREKILCQVNKICCEDCPNKTCDDCRVPMAFTGITSMAGAAKEHAGVQDDRLKPCPFCGGTAHVMPSLYYVYCEDCGATVRGNVPIIHGQISEEKAERASIEAWNRRTE